MILFHKKLTILNFDYFEPCYCLGYCEFHNPNDINQPKQSVQFRILTENLQEFVLEKPDSVCKVETFKKGVHLHPLFHCTYRNLSLVYFNFSGRNFVSEAEFRMEFSPECHSQKQLASPIIYEHPPLAHRWTLPRTFS